MARGNAFTIGKKRLCIVSSARPPALSSKPRADVAGGRRANWRAPKSQIRERSLLRRRARLRVVRRKHARDQIRQLRVRGAQVPVGLRDRARRVDDEDLGRVHAHRAVRKQVSVAIAETGVEGLVLGAKDVAHTGGDFAKQHAKSSIQTERTECE